MSRVLRKSKWSYLFDFIVIIAGISVSFLLNEWREEKRVEEKKEVLLVDISKDLYTDSVVLDRMLNHYTIMSNAHDSLLKYTEGELDPDSLNHYLDYVTSYIPFTPTANTYKRINADPEINIERKDSMIWYYLNLHNIVYPRLNSMFEVEKEFVLKQALPYMDKNAPFIHPGATFISFKGEVFYALRKEDEFMNYIKSGRVYKKAMVGFTTQAFDYLKGIKAKTRAEIIRNKNSD